MIMLGPRPTPGGTEYPVNSNEDEFPF